jgi:hypothetical protein
VEAVLGAIINGICILLGGVVGLKSAWQPPATTQQRLKVLLGALTVYVGLSSVWTGLSGSLGHRMKQFGVVVLALMLGKLTGHLLRIQTKFNRLGRYAKERVVAAQPGGVQPYSEGFVTCALLFCLGPLAVPGALLDGLRGDFKALAIKAVMDGLATLAFARSFGWGALLAALPVMVYQGTITLGAKAVLPWLERQAVLEPVCATCGFMIFSVSLVILGIKKVELADYLPSLLYAPALAWLVR